RNSEQSRSHGGLEPVCLGSPTAGRGATRHQDHCDQQEYIERQVEQTLGICLDGDTGQRASRQCKPGSPAIGICPASVSHPHRCCQETSSYCIRQDHQEISIESLKVPAHTGSAEECE